MFDHLDPEKLGVLMERRLGRPGRWLFNAALFMSGLFALAFTLRYILDEFIGQLIWPFFSRVFGGSTGALTLDSIEAVVLTMTVTIAVLLIIMVGTFFLLVRTVRRRAVSQTAIDELAEMRSQGISVLNELPSKLGGFDKWTAKWEAWRNEVVSVLRDHFTKAETLSFSRLGVIREAPFGMAESPEHQHALMMLSKQLSILEGLIQRHQERR